MKNTVVYRGAKVAPSKVVCVGRNYVDHIKELNNAVPVEPVIFIKPNSAISGELNLHGGDEIHYEAEIAFLIQDDELTGVGFALDLTKRVIQNKLKSKGLPWERAKAFDGSAVFSEFVQIKGSVDDLNLELHINKQLQQKGGCDMMLYQPNELLTEINSFLSLEDDDVMMTGTPAGVGQIHVGDEFVGRIFSGEKLLLEARWMAG